MENDQETPTPTSEPTPSEAPVAEALDANNNANGGMVDITPNLPGDKRPGAPRGNKNGQTRGGLWALNRGRQRNLPVDRRTRSGRVERLIQQWLTTDYGGPEALTARQTILIGLVALDCARLDQHKRSRRLLIRKKKEGAKARGTDPRIVEHPKEIAALDTYVQPVITSLRSNLVALGPEPEAQQEKLQDILQRIAEGEERK